MSTHDVIDLLIKSQLVINQKPMHFIYQDKIDDSSLSVNLSHSQLTSITSTGKLSQRSFQLLQSYYNVKIEYHRVITECMYCITEYRHTITEMYDRAYYTAQDVNHIACKDITFIGHVILYVITGNDRLNNNYMAVTTKSTDLL